MSGSRKEFEELFQQYKGYVYAICYRYCGTKQDALDLTQDVFLKILKNWDKADAGKELKPWIRRITVNTCLNFKRDKKQALSLDAGEEELSLLDQVAGPEDTEETVLNHLNGERLDKLVSELRPVQRTAIILRHYEGLSYKQIAKTMKKPEGTVKTYLYQGRKVLAEKLNEGKGSEVLP
jgi:RNA polymerase sigma-70 factor (ECF subfamily)